jgi:hypothetical protein
MSDHRHEIAELHRAIEKIGVERKAIEKEIERLARVTSILEAQAKSNKPKQAMRWLAKMIPRLASRLPNKQEWSARLSVWSGLASLLLSIVALFYALAPRVSLSIADSVDPNDAFATNLSISNEGSLPIYDVSFFCTVNQITAPRNVKVIGGLKLTSGVTVPRIDPAHTFTTNQNSKFCPMGDMGSPTGLLRINSGITGVDVFMVVDFRPAWWPVHIEQSFHFVTERSKDGHFIWEEET